MENVLRYLAIKMYVYLERVNNKTYNFLRTLKLFIKSKIVRTSDGFLLISISADPLWSYETIRLTYSNYNSYTLKRL